MHVLVTAASRHGSTAEIAAAIRGHLVDRGLDASLLDPDRVTTLQPYDAVVLGSAVYAGRWTKPARELVERVADQWSECPVWLFSSGPVGDPLKPDDDTVDVAATMETTGARDHVVLPGRVDRSLLGFGERAIVRALHVPDGDFRDWAAVEDFARTVAESLHAEVEETADSDGAMA